MSYNKSFTIEQELQFLHILGFSVKGSLKMGYWEIFDAKEKKIGFIKRIMHDSLGFWMKFKSKRILYDGCRKVCCRDSVNGYPFWFLLRESSKDEISGCFKLGKTKEVMIDSATFGKLNFSIGKAELNASHVRTTDGFDVSENMSYFLWPNRNVAGDLLRHYQYYLQYQKKGSEVVEGDSFEVDYVAPYYDDIERIKVGVSHYENYCQKDCFKEIIEEDMNVAIEKQEMGLDLIRYMRNLFNHLMGTDIIGNMAEKVDLPEDLLFVLQSRKERDLVRERMKSQG